MSSYSQVTKHPITGEYEKAEYIDDYFGPHGYAVKFPSDEKYWPVQLVDDSQIHTFWVQDVIAAWQYMTGFAANETALITFLNQINREYKARWERDPLGGEGAMEWFQDHVL